MVILLACFLASSSTCSTRAEEAGHLFSEGISVETVSSKRGKYETNLRELERFRVGEYAKYGVASEAEKGEIVRRVRQRLERVLRQDIFPAWYGTDWAFHGISTVPGEGQIACGYFVSTCLVQINFKVPRIKLAQQPSQGIIDTFVDRKDRWILVGKPVEEIRQSLTKRGDGLYLVGLDTHVGFVSVVGDDMAFIHASYYEPGSFVKAEPLDTRNPFRDSQYRVFGKLFSDKMIAKWLASESFVVGEG